MLDKLIIYESYLNQDLVPKLLDDPQENVVIGVIGLLEHTNTPICHKMYLEDKDFVNAH